MNLFPLAISLATLTLLGVMTYVMPSLARRSVPLGVSVPENRLDDPAVHNAVGFYRLTVFLAYIVCVVLTILLATAFAVLTILVPIVLFLIVVFAGYVWFRGMIVHAKRDGDWYANPQVHTASAVTIDSEHRPGAPLVWYLAAVVVLIVTVAVGTAIYNALPDPIVTHFNATGHPDQYAPKSVWSVFGSLLIGFAVVILLYVIALLVRRAPLRAAASDDPALAAHRAVHGARLIQDLLGQLALAIALEFAALSLILWFAPGSSSLVLGSTLVILVLFFAVLLIFVVRYRRSIAGPERREHPNSVSSPDNDRFWKLGAFYVNRRDKALIVPKRFGVGWTINLGHPGGMAIGILTVLAIVGVIILVPVLGHQNGIR